MDPERDCLEHDQPGGKLLTKAGTPRCPACRRLPGCPQPTPQRRRGATRVRTRPVTVVRLVQLGESRPPEGLWEVAPVLSMPVVSRADAAAAAAAGQRVALTYWTKLAGRSRLAQVAEGAKCLGQRVRVYRAAGAERVEWLDSGGSLHLMPADRNHPAWRGITFDVVAEAGG